MRSPKHPIFLWRSNPDWYRIENRQFVLTELAPPKAIESFELYKKDLIEQKQSGIRRS